MKRRVAASFAAILVCGLLPVAHARAADVAGTPPRAMALAAGDTVPALAAPAMAPAARPIPFETMPLPSLHGRPHRLAYVCLAAGAGLVGASFAIANRADRSYERYLSADAPDDIQREFDDATRLDRWSSGSLFTGEALFAAGLYLRFLRRSPQGLAVTMIPGACAIAYRF